MLNRKAPKGQKNSDGGITPGQANDPPKMSPKGAKEIYQNEESENVQCSMKNETSRGG